MGKIKEFQTDLKVILDAEETLDITDTILIKFRRPDGTTEERTATILETDANKAYYNLLVDDSDLLTPTGQYLAILDITASDGRKIKGETDKFDVYKEFEL